MSKIKIKSFEDACKALKLKPETVTSPSDTKDEAAYKKLKVIAKALNGDWAADWSNREQWKYTPYFLHKDGFGLAFNDYDRWFTFTSVGSRLCYKSSALAEYAGTQFADLYQDFLS